ncbi:Zinc finger CCHC domain-containing protein 12 [Merluccius polli]|uniref:Zinc finger CCHC domain-containing protein 12 n=1 Tax=Merluccius polli TaxID=89951 RepID=A0AA47NVH7_MERPO|nr:Zinc finger CCHC domain-containing protein 12 [Merluccius polli]
MDFLKQYGSIGRFIKVSDQNSEFFGKVIVEYNSGAAVETLENDLPLDKTSDSDANVVYHIEALASVYSTGKGTTLTTTFLSELQNIAKLSGKPFEHLLRDELTRITGLVTESSQGAESNDQGTVVAPAETDQGPISPDATQTDSEINGQNQTIEPPNTTFRTNVHAMPTLRASAPSSFPSPELLNPPEVQRPRANPKAFLDLLDSAYATVEDGDELFAQFLNVNQNSGEKPSNYLQRLQTLLIRVVKMKTISPKDSDKQLLKQFCIGCWHNALINTLQLEQRKDNLPTFPEFLLLLRTEEDKQTAKANRMKQHLGLQKPKAQAAANMHEAFFPDTFDTQPSFSNPPSVVQQIQKQIVDLQAQIAVLSTPKRDPPIFQKPAMKKEKERQKEKPLTKKTPNPEPTSETKAATVKQRPKPWYCFRCGEDGHIATSCNDPPNPTLVAAKRNLLKEKQQAWERDNPTPKSI